MFLMSYDAAEPAPKVGKTLSDLSLIMLLSAEVSELRELPELPEFPELLLTLFWMIKKEMALFS